MADEAQTPPPSNGRRRLPIIIGGVVVLLLAIGVWLWLSSGKESTDDAQIDGTITQIAARVGGTVTAVNVKDNQLVKAGDVLVQIEKRDYEVAVDRARAELADAQAQAAAAGTGVPIAEVSTRSDVTTASGGVEEAQAGIAVADRQVESARAALVAAEARLRERQATATKNEQDVARLKPLVAKEEIPKQQFDAAVASADAARAAADAAESDVAAARTAIAVAEQRAVQARAAADRAKAGLQAAQTAPQQLKVTRARAEAAAARVKQAEAALAQAELNLARTTVRAPSDGVVSRKSVEVGQVVQSNQPLLALVDLTDVWVVANFKETQLRDMRTGQAAVVEVDALGGQEFKGHIDSIAAATGAKFSLLPAENATGNYVKVVQRVPVKIVFEPGQDPDHRMRPGMSVVPTVYTK